MSKLKALLYSFKVKVTLVLLFSLFFVMALSDFVIYKFSLNEQFNQLREKLIAVAQTAALMVDADLLESVPLNKDGISTSQYQIISHTLNRIKRANPDIKYIYTMARTDKKDMLQFIVDPEPDDASQVQATAFPGDTYDATRCPEIFNAFKAPSADKSFTVDEWGVFLSGYAPVIDKTGKAIAVLGVDMTAEDVYLVQNTMHKRAFLVLVFGVFLSIGLGLLISKRITDRIEKIVEGTRHIAADDLEYKVEVKGHDEITELANSFNNMAMSLAESKEKLKIYFFRVVQSLVRILEAKDPYTRGHSDRVSEYSQEIAEQMGFSRDKVEALGRVAELHDIGKLVIQKDILNKPSKLNDDEWKMIKEHPVIGEDVLKPILLDEEMLAMVRSHHERYDGNGYPDGLKGENINLFAQIISVADAYDAMTSNRAYRSAMTREKATEELKQCRESQFNPKIVDAFIRVIEDK